MKLSEMTNLQFSKELASDAPAPGGGSVAALTASLGVALVHMVSALSVGKPKYAEHAELITEALKDANELRLALIDCMDRDTEVFGQMEAVFKMPKSTDEEKAKRSKAMQEALRACSVVPLEVMKLCCNGLSLTQKCIGKTNVSAASDLGVAALTLKAGIQGAWLNVLINISGVKDDNFVRDYRQAGSELLEKSLHMADEIYEAICKGIS